MRVLHIEVGGTYGGSTRALELYLRHCDPVALDHDVLFYYETPRAEGFRRIARRVTVLYPRQTAVAGDGARRGPLAGSVARWLGRVDAWVDLRTLVGLARGLPSLRRLRDLVVAGGYDVIHVNNTFSYHPESILAARWAGRPVVAHMRMTVRPTPLNRWLGRRLACLLTENQRFCDELPAMGIECPAQPWYAGIEVSMPRPEDVGRVRRDLAGPYGVLIGSAGRLEDQKGYEYLVHAARLVVDRHGDVRFVVAGSGPGRSRLEQLIRDSSLEDRFRLLDFRPDVPAVIASCDMFVSSSLWEGLPLAILEAMILERPVVATDVGAVRDVVRPGETGMLVPPRDPHRLAEAICELLADPARGREYASRARGLALTYTNLRSRADALDRILADVAGTTQDRGAGTARADGMSAAEGATTGRGRQRTVRPAEPSAKP